MSTDLARRTLGVSDGKYSWMHFRLGSAYFDLQNWEFARQSFQKAAELDPKDAPSAYNVALCFVRLSYYKDAANWYEEYLRRKPDAPDRDDIRQQIKKFRNLY